MRQVSNWSATALSKAIGRIQDTVKSTRSGLGLEQAACERLIMELSRLARTGRG